jgi:hypothetical protein
VQLERNLMKSVVSAWLHYKVNSILDNGGHCNEKCLSPAAKKIMTRSFLFISERCAATICNP